MIGVTHTETSRTTSEQDGRWWTVITRRQQWADTPDNAAYAGRTYRVTDTWVSDTPDHLGMLVSSTSYPWQTGPRSGSA
jgi:hypothetical protein